MEEPGGERDVAAVLAIVSGIARELGYDGLSERAEECDEGA